MKITDKITLLVLFLLGVLLANTLVGIRHIDRVRTEFAVMAEGDTIFMEAVTSVEQNQLAQGILTQKLAGIAEELGDADLSFSRKQYLLDQLKPLQDGFGHYASRTRSDIVLARAALNRSMGTARDDQKKTDLRRAFEGLVRIENARKAYEDVIARISSAVGSGGFQLSLEDLTDVQRQDKAIAADVRSLLKEAQGLMRRSLERAGYWQMHAERILTLLLLISIVAGIFLAIWIVTGIARPLRDLGDAAQQVGQGDFSLRLNASSKDEIAAVAQAFNTMSMKLEETRQDLGRKNAALTHDIAGPLTVIVGYAAYLEKRYGDTLDEKSKEALSGIRKGAVKMNALVRELLKSS